MSNPNIVVKALDLNSLDSVRTFAEDILKTEDRIDYLICNAGDIDNNMGVPCTLVIVSQPLSDIGIMALPTLEHTADGFEKQIGKSSQQISMSLSCVLYYALC